MVQGYSEEETSQLEAFFSALKNESSLQIFQQLEKPFTSGKEEIEKLGLTERKYYRRLRELVDTGLAKRSQDNTYELTYVGKRMHQFIFNELSDFIRNRDQAQNMGELLKSSESSTLYDLLGSLDENTFKLAEQVCFAPAKIYVIEDESGYTKILDGEVRRSKKEVLFGGKTISASGLEPIRDALDRNIKVQIIVDSRGTVAKFVKSLDRVIEYSDSEEVDYFRSILRSENLNLSFTELPYSIFVVDRERSILGDLEARDGGFTAFYLDNEEIAEKLAAIFQDWQDRATKW